MLGALQFGLPMLQKLERCLRRAIVLNITALSHFDPPEPLDRILLPLGLFAIRIYRAILSPWLGRQCLFRPTCSQRALRSLSRFGWTGGIREISNQLRRCSGNYLLRLNKDGNLEMQTLDGTIYPESELSSLIKQDLKQTLPPSIL
ncbi:MAG: membrane protein insertion efficiency factor YidD [Alphaproteobacteria bacterium]